MDRAGNQQVQLVGKKKNRMWGGCNEWAYFDVPSDIIIEVGRAQFTLHKFPLVSRCGRIRKLLAEQRSSEIPKLKLINLPGGPESFEMAAKFCYGVNFEIIPSSVAMLICVSEFLEMTEEYSTGNLASRAKSYLNTVVCKSLEMSVEVLRKCENLLPLADDLNIVGSCIDAVASKACMEQIASSFSRLEYSSSGRLQMGKQAECGGDWWIEDLSVLRVDFYKRVIEAVRCRGVRPESISASLMNYAEKLLSRKPALSNAVARANNNISFTSSIEEDREIVETIVGLLPVEKPTVPVTFLFGLLRVAVALDCTISCRLNLERRVGSQLELATLDDLLMLSCWNSVNTLLEVDTVHRILVNFSQQDDSESDSDVGSGYGSDGLCPPSQTALLKVANLVDSFLAEIAPASNLKLAKFIDIAETLPEHARTTDDELYHAVDLYLKANNGLSDIEKKRLCKLINFQKLSEEAGAHAAQNERLPLQMIVQVLYFEHLRLRNALHCNYPDNDQKNAHLPWRINSCTPSAAMSPRDNYASLRRENRELKLELVRMRMRLNNLEKGQACMKEDMERSNSKKFMCSISSKLKKLNFFSSSVSRGPTSPTKHSLET